MKSTTARRCRSCGQVLAPITGRGRPRVTCPDDVSPDGRCRSREENRRREARLAHQYAAATTHPDAIAGRASAYDEASAVAGLVLLADALGGLEDRAALEDPLGASGFVLLSVPRDVYLRARRLWQDLLAAERRQPVSRPRREICRVSCPIFALGYRPEVVQRAVLRRLARAELNGA